MLTDYAISGAPDLTLDQFARILRDAQSPAWPEATHIYAALKATGVRPAVWLAFGWVESKLGREGIVKDFDTKNMGNVRSPESAALGTTIDTPRGKFAKYANWADGAFDWGKRLTGSKYAGAGLTTVRAVLPKYAPSGDQGNSPTAYINAVLASITEWTKGAPPVAQPTIAISAGHHNKQRGDTFEIEQTGQLARAVGDACKALGLRVVYLTPDDGLGFSTASLDTVAAQINTMNPRPAIYLETHTEGGGGTGVFAIHPDAPGDVDTDVRDTLGPLVARKIAAATGLGLGAGGDGVMSERQTGVGGAGDRLGIFRATEPSKAETTRLIIEYGAHDKQPDLTLVKRPGFYAAAGKATAAAFAEFLGLSTAVTPDPPVIIPSADPGFPGALQPDGTSQLNGVNFEGTLVRVEWVQLGGVNAAGERYSRKWSGHQLEEWVRTG